MSFTTFKLSRNGQTRKVVFNSFPVWPELAARIESLYQLPTTQVGVSYVDSDGDEVTLSSTEELNDFYRSEPTQPYKFSVQDLGAIREEFHTPPTSTGLQSNRNSGNTFGAPQDFYVDIGDDWQQLGDSHNLFNIPPPSSSATPHAYIEVLDSDISKLPEETDDETDIASVSSDIMNLKRETSFSSLRDKGKGKALNSAPTTVQEDVSSTGSVLAEDAPSKFPLHVYDVGSQKLSDSRSIAGRTSESGQSTVVPTRESIEPSTATLPAQEAFNPANVALPEPVLSNTEKPHPSEDTADPPLASLPEASPASLTHDVAVLLSAFQRAFSSHPEVTDGLRVIMNNTSNGSYWTAHRDAIHRAAESVTRQAETAASETVHRLSEEESARRVADAVGNIVQAFSRTFGATASTGEPQTGSTHPPPPDADSPRSSMWGHGFPFGPGRRGGRFHHGRGGRPHSGHGWPFGDDWFKGFEGRPFGPPPPGPHGPFGMDLPGGFVPWEAGSDFSRGPRGHRGRGHHRRPGSPGSPPPGQPRHEHQHAHGPPPPPPPPPPGPHHMPPPPPPPGPFGMPPPPPGPHGMPPPPPPGPHRGPPFGPPGAHRHLGHHGHPDEPHHEDHRRGPMALVRHPRQIPPGPPRAPPAPPVLAEPDRELTHQELRERVEAAKRIYKVEKARYRKDREQRRRQPGASANVVTTVEKKEEIKPADTVKAPVAATPSSAATPELPTTASNARGQYPGLEVVSITPWNTIRPSATTSQKSSTPVPGPSTRPSVAPSPSPALVHRRNTSKADGAGPSTRSIQRITRRLADMGFTENAFVDLPRKIQAQVGPGNVIPQDKEDDVVTNLIEELLATSPKTPVASGSGIRRDADANSLPGSWY